MKYTLGTLPVNRSVIARYKDEIRMLQAYGENTPVRWTMFTNQPGWQGVEGRRSIKHTGESAPGDEDACRGGGGYRWSCNNALKIGWSVTINRRDLYDGNGKAEFV